MAGRVVSISLVAFDNMSRTFDRSAKSVDKLSKKLDGLQKIGMGVGLATAAAGALALSKAAAPAAAAVAALPTAMATAVTAAVTLKVATSGVGDAFKAVASGDAKKMDEALKKLAPSAQAFVKELASMKKEATGLKKAVQQRFFLNLSGDIDKLGKTGLPVARKGMVQVAGALNGIARSAIKAASTKWFQGQVAQVFRTSASLLTTMRGAVAPLLQMIVKLINLGTPLAKRFTDWAVASIKAAAAFVLSKDGAAKLRDLFQKAGNVTGQLVRILKNLAIGLAEIIGKSDTFTVNGKDMLTTIELLSIKFKEWSQSTEGQKQITDTFKLLRDVLEQLSKITPLIVGPMSQVLLILNSTHGPVRDVVVQMLAWSVVISLVVTRLKLLAVASALFKGGKLFTQFASGFMSVSRGAAQGASGATRFGSALRANASIIVHSIIDMFRLAASWVAAKAAMVGGWIATAARNLGNLAKAAFLASKAALANAAAQVRARLATMASAALQGVIRLGLLAWAAAQWVLNASLYGFPLIWIVVAIAAFVAVLILAWKKSDTFRKIITTAFNAVKNAIMVAVNFIVDFVKSHWKLMVAAITGPMFIVVFLVLKYWRQIWDFITAAVSFIIDFVKKHWRLIVSIIGGPIVAVVLLVIQYWDKIKAFISKVVSAILSWVKSHWRLIVSIIGGPIAAAVVLVTKHWNSIKNTTQRLWNSIKSYLSNTLNNIKRGFSVAVGAIGRTWDRLKNAAKTPVNFVIGIYNNGIRGLVSNLTKLVGHQVNLPKVHTFARGGVMPGYAPGNDSLLAMVSPGESIFRPEFTRAVGSAWVNTANAVAKTKGPKGVKDWLRFGGEKLGAEGLGFSRGGTVPGYAGAFGLGGIVGGLVKGLKNFAFDNVEKAVGKAISKLLGGAVPGGGMIHDIVAKIPDWIKNQLMKWVKGKLDGLMGGKGMKGALNWAKSQRGKPYVWGGVGPGGYDCSGFMSAITNVIHGKNPYSRLFTTFSFGGQRAPGGFVRNAKSGFMVGVTNAGVGHMAGTLLGQNVESSGSAGVRVGSSARGANNGLFGMHYGLKADTGRLLLQQGWNPPVFNGTGRPEMLTTEAAAGDVHLHVDNHGVIGSQQELLNWLIKNLDTLRRQGRLKIPTR